MFDFRDDGIEDLVGFYSTEGFWVGERVDLWEGDDADRLAGVVPEISVRSDCERFSAAICVDGLMLLRMRHLAASRPGMGDPRQIAASVRWWEEHVDYANAMQLLMESESIMCPDSGEVIASAVTVAETCRVGFDGGRPIRRSQSGGRSLVSVRHETANWLRGGRKGTPPMEAISSGWSTWLVVTEESVISMLGKFEIASADPTLVRRLSFIARAKSAYARNDFQVAFTLLWFVIESAAKDLRSSVGGGNGSNRRGGFASIGSIFAELRAEGVIGDELFSRLDDLRGRVRNRLMHESDSASCLPEDCMSAAGGAVDLSVRDAPLDIRTKWAYGVEF